MYIRYMYATFTTCRHIPMCSKSYIQATTSLVPRPPPFFFHWFTFSIIHGSGRARKTLPCIILNANRRTKNQGGLGMRLGHHHKACSESVQSLRLFMDCSCLIPRPWHLGLGTRQVDSVRRSSYDYLGLGLRQFVAVDEATWLMK